MSQDLFPGGNRLWHVRLRSRHVVLRARLLLVPVAVAAITAACAAAGTYPPRTPKDDCERWGGNWRTHLGFCEYQGDSPK